MKRMKTDIKSLILGAVVALAAVCLGEGIARADCDYAPTETEDQAGYDRAFSYAEAMADVLEGAGRGYNCEVIQLQDGSFEAQCDEVAHAVESRACSGWAFGFGLGENDGESMYEACMVIALHTGLVSL